MTSTTRKESGVPWLGQIPAHWSLNYLGNVVNVSGGCTPSKENLDFWNGSIPWVSPKDMKRDVISDSEDHVTDLALKKSSLRLIPSPSVLMVIRGMILDHTVPIGLTARPVTVNQDMKALRPQAGISAQFLAHFLRAMNEPLLARVEEAGHGTKALRTDLWRKLPVLIPPEPEQHAIVSFLDRKSAAIDALIAKKERLIDLLREKRQALIMQAVTKGLDPNVPMRDSGIEWLGHVPQHWCVVPLRRLVASQLAGPYGSSLTKAMYTGAGIRVYGQQQVIPDDFSIGDYYISADKFSEMRKYEVHSGDLLVTVMGTIGRVAVVPENVERGIMNPRLVRYVINEQHASPHFVAWVLRSHVGTSQLAEAAQGSTMDGLNLRILGDVVLAIPPRAEQNAIVARIAAISSGSKRIAARIDCQVERLREYRQALITAAVTGKIDLSKEAA